MSNSKKKKVKTGKKEKELLKSLSDNGVEIIQFTRESRTPIVSERIQRSKDWVFFGEDNLWPNELIFMADNSALHSAILDIKSKMIAGDGIIYEKENSEAQKFLEDSTSQWGGLNKLIDRLSVDVAYFNSFYLNVQFNLGGQIGTIRHLDYSFVRSGKMQPDTRKVNEYWMSTRWDISTRKMTYSEEEEIYRPIEILAFDPNQMGEKISKKNGQIIVGKKYSPSVLYYSKPTYLGCVNQIEIAAKIANFHKSQLDNGMTGNLHMHIKQDLSDVTKRTKMLQALNDQYAGSNNAGRIFLTWGTGEQNIPELNPINTSDVHGALSELNTRTNEDIAMAHEISRSIVGLDQSTGLGGLEMDKAMDMLQTVYVTPSQQLIEDEINYILQFNGINEKIKIERLKLSTLILSDEMMKLSATVDEVRDIANLQPHEDKVKGDKLLIEIENTEKDGRGSNSIGKE